MLTTMDTAARLAVILLVGSVFATFGLFEIDRIWGDQAAQWSAVIFTLVIMFLGAMPALISLRRRE